MGKYAGIYQWARDMGSARMRLRVWVGGLDIKRSCSWLKWQTKGAPRRKGCEYSSSQALAVNWGSLVHVGSVGSSTVCTRKQKAMWLEHGGLVRGQASWDPVGKHPTTLSTTFWLENLCGRCMDNESRQGRLNARDQLEG